MIILISIWSQMKGNATNPWGSVYESPGIFTSYKLWKVQLNPLKNKFYIFLQTCLLRQFLFSISQCRYYWNFRYLRIFSWIISWKYGSCILNVNCKILTSHHFPPTTLLCSNVAQLKVSPVHFQSCSHMTSTNGLTLNNCNKYSIIAINIQ